MNVRVYGRPAHFVHPILRLDRYFMLPLSLYVSFSNLQDKVWSYIEEALLSEDNASGDSAFISTVKEEGGANIAEKDD
jgi:hypothetical protein